MRKLIFALTFAAGIFASEANAQNTISPTNPNIQYSGRWNFDNPNRPWVAWQGSTITVKFNGTYLKADFNPGSGTEQYRVILNGVAAEDRIFASAGRAEYTLVSGLPEGEHTVTLFRETFYNSNMVFFGLETDGYVLTPDPKPPLKIAFFGDSNMDGTSNYSEKDSGDMGTYYAYPAMLSRMLNAEMHLQAFSGATLGGNGSNTVASFIYSQDWYNQDANYRSGFDPDIIVVNAGANDVGRSQTQIENRYRTVVSELRNVYGNEPHIVLMNAYGWNPNEPANYSSLLVDEIGGNLSYLYFPWLFEQFHGSQWEHAGQVQRLADHLESINPAWARVNPGDIVDGFGRNGDVANGSFENTAPFGSFGWRYFDDGLERINNSAQAADGDWYVRLSQGEEIHQANDATGDFKPGATEGGETYTITAKIRAVGGNAKVKFSTHFQGQEIYTHDDDPSLFQESTQVVSNTSWQDYSHTASANSGAWAVYQYIIAQSGTIEVDDVRMVTNTDQVMIAAQLSANKQRPKNRIRVNLSWSGATSSKVDIYRFNKLVTTTNNDGAYRDFIRGTTSGSFIYRVCNTGTTQCSDTINLSL
jgi:lysophospholipase L1-like esterase